MSDAASAWSFGSVSPEWEPLEVATGDTLLVDARIAGQSVRAVLDSGSGATVIDPQLASRLDMSAGPERTISGLGGKASARLIHDVDIQFGHQTRRLPFAVVADLGAPSAAFGRQIGMLLGADLFAGNCIALDFGHRQFAITQSGSFLAGPDWTALPIGHGARQELYVMVSVAGLPPAPVMIDLGSSSPLMLSSAYVSANNLVDGRPTSKAAIGGVEGIATADVFMAPKLEIGGLTVNAIPALGVTNWLSTSTIGNIGLPVIGQFDVVFDVTAGFVWLRPAPARSRLPMLKDRSGLGVSTSKDALTVVHVAAGSPAAKAGWIVGERIIAVDGHPIGANYTHGPLWSWRFGPAGTRVALHMAEGVTRHLSLGDYY